MAGRPRLQLVWWWLEDWRWFALLGPYPRDGVNRGLVFAWRVRIGPVEVRRWAELPTARGAG